MTKIRLLGADTVPNKNVEPEEQGRGERILGQRRGKGHLPGREKKTGFLVGRT